MNHSSIMTQYEISEEQKLVLEYIRQGKHVTVDACAGSGKSTTILAIAKEMPTYQFLQMAYNSMLRCEFKEKVTTQGLKNVRVHTFHSLAVQYYYRNANTDTGIRHILYHKLDPLSPIPNFDVLVIDEAQDMTLLYFQFMWKVAMDVGKTFQILILGDYMQGLYEFKGADIRFLTMADQIWIKHPHLYTGFSNGVYNPIPQFVKCTLKTSYRITQPMADFVNNVMLGEKRLYAVKNGCRVIYNRNSRGNQEKYVVSQIKQLLTSGEKPDDIFVLGASVKGANSNIRKMENALVECGIPCFVPMLENDKIDERVIAGKVVFSTFHAVKGRQRKYVFVLGFDDSYFTYFAKNMNPDICPNTLYVACTRATTALYILEIDQRSTDKPLSFLKMSHQEMRSQPYIDFKGIPRSIFYNQAPSEDEIEILTHYVTPTKLIEFVAESVLEEVTPILDRIFRKISNETVDDLIDIPTVLETKLGFFEDVSDLNGIAIPCMYYDAILGQGGLDSNREEDTTTSCMHEMIQVMVKELKPNEHGFLKKYVRDLPNTCTSAADYLFLANIFVSLQEKLYFKLKQIEREEYHWITSATLDNARARLDYVIGIPEEPLVEHTFIQVKDESAHLEIDRILAQFTTEHIYRFTARVDLVTESTIWELKCTSQLSTDHLLQVVIYAWLWKLTHKDDEKQFRILNIKTGEILELMDQMEDWTKIVVALLKGKYEKMDSKTDGDFIESCSLYA